MLLGQVLDGPKEGEEYWVGQVGDQYPDDHRPLGAEAAGRGAGEVAQAVGGGPHSPGGVFAGWPFSGQDP